MARLPMSTPAPSVSVAPPRAPFARREAALLGLAVVALANFAGLGGWLQAALGGAGLGLAFALLLAVVMWGAFRVVHHAEDIAGGVGEPAGTLVLTLAVIGIEVALVVALMLSGAAEPTAARDTMYSVLMLATNLVLGLALVCGSARRGSARHNLQGSTAYIGTLIVLAGLSLVWPRLAESAPDGEVSALQSPFLVVASLCCYGVFLAIQTGRARGWFQEEDGEPASASESDLASASNGHARRTALTPSLLLLLAYLGAIILLAEQMAHSLEGVVAALELPHAISGLVVAAIILAPEALAAVQAANSRQMQRAVNLSLGSALSTIGLTVPAVLLVSLATGHTVVLGLEPTEILLLSLTFLLSINTLSTGRTNQLHGVLHLALFAAGVVLIFDGS
jgi:Ca2+:H+ antiporter